MQTDQPGNQNNHIELADEGFQHGKGPCFWGQRGNVSVAQGGEGDEAVVTKGTRIGTCLVIGNAERSGLLTL